MKNWMLIALAALGITLGCGKRDPEPDTPDQDPIEELEDLDEENEDSGY